MATAHLSLHREAAKIARQGGRDLDLNRCRPCGHVPPHNSPGPQFPQLCGRAAHSGRKAQSLRAGGQAGKWAPGTKQAPGLKPSQLAPDRGSCTWVVGPQGEGGATLVAVPAATHRLLTTKAPLGAFPCATQPHTRRSTPCKAQSWLGSQQLWRCSAGPGSLAL